MRMRRHTPFLAGARIAWVATLACLAAPASPDTVHLKNGDHISGRVSTSGARSYRVQTPYGRLIIPRDKVELIVYDDGREEVPGAPARDGAPRGAGARLEIVVRGDSYWRAWDPKEAPADPALRLAISVDDKLVAAYTDRQLDSDIRGAVVNTFAFNPSATSRTLWNDTGAQAPETAQGRVTLRLDLRPPLAGHRRLVLKYQTNAGSVAEPQWTDLAAAEIVYEAVEGKPAAVHVDQARGEMSFGGMLRKKKMRNEETFVVQLTQAEEHDGAPSPP